MRNYYRILSFLLSIVLLFSNITVPVGATGMDGDNVSGNDVVITAEESTETEEYSEVESSSEPGEELGTEFCPETEVDPEEEITVIETESALEETESVLEKTESTETVEESVEANSVSDNQATSKVQDEVSLMAATYTKYSDAVKYVRNQMVKRKTSIEVNVPVSMFEKNSELIIDLVNDAVAHTESGSGQEGDALAWTVSLESASMQMSGTTATIELSISYGTTAAQEEALTAKVKEILDGLAFTDETTEYEKVKAIHDYICDNVDYDSTIQKYEAYDALCTGTSVCEGYAISFYRLCKEVGLSVRIIGGKGQNADHAWNIVRIGDVYYNIDCTWDGQEAKTYDTWFLLNEIDFVSHTRFSQYATDEFYETYPMAEYSYGKSTISTLGTANLEQTYTTIDGTTISSKATNGKPKLLIFFNVNCINSQSTIKSLVDYDLDGIDVYAIDMMKNSKDAVKAFKESYGSEHIIFSYATDNTNSYNAYYYRNLADPELTGYNFPMVCYIDGNNKYQYMRMGISSGRQISSILQATCSYTEKFREYGITYYLDGGENPVENPAKYTAHTDTITLKDASKTGYAFKGWYSDQKCTEKVTQITKGTRKNINLYAKFVKELELTVPTKTTYLVGEKIDLTNGSITHVESGQTSALKSTMIKGFDSSKEGECTVTVTYKGCSTTYPVLVVAEPEEMSADYAQSLSQLALPVSEYGEYSWVEGSQKLETVGANACTAIFSPYDTECYSTRADINVLINVYRSIADVAEIRVENGDFVYNGSAYKPEVTVYLEEELLEPENYTVLYTNNIGAGTASITVTGQKYYKDSAETNFTIHKADLTVIAGDLTLCIGEELPTACEYEVIGLAQGEKLTREPEFIFTATDTSVTGIYEIVPSNARASDNYNSDITYVNGKLLVAEEKVGYTVTFNVNGHGDEPEAYLGVKSGDVIAKPVEPVAKGYAFDGWYKDEKCTKLWDFDMDTVQSDIILYAKWNVVKEDISLCVSEVSDVYYTGKALKPAVKVYDNGVLLKVNKDYKISYHNNTNVNVMEAGEEFNDKLPYIVITGKGNYTDEIKINFNILQAVIGDENQNPAAGVVVSCSDQLTVNTKKNVNPLKSVKLGRNMKKNVDYVVSLEAIDVRDAGGNPVTEELTEPLIPAGYNGTFKLTITGIGNYTGSIVKNIVVANKAVLIKNATITLGKNLKTIDYNRFSEELDKELKAGYYDSKTKKYYAVYNGVVDYDTQVDAKNVFVVKCGGKSLIYGRDFEVFYANCDKFGKATMTIQGIGDYSGSKSVTFTLKGKIFNAKKVNVVGLSDKTYTSKPITQNDVQLIYEDGSELVYGTDYTISYAKHINKGKATITFTAKGDSGYQGSFKKNFNILAAPIQEVVQDASMANIFVEYDKAGVKPADKVILTNAAGKRLVEGKDYKLTYKYNKAVATKQSENVPTIVIKGSGNYGGAYLEVPFEITKASLKNAKVAVTVKEVQFNTKKVDSYAYKPAVKVADGKKNLKANKDYIIQYANNTQADYRAYYIDKSVSGEEYMPRAIITAVENGNYVCEEPIIIPLPVYQTKLVKSKMRVEIEDAKYAGYQVMPKVTVYCMTTDGEIHLEENVDYTLSYGTNVKAGKKKGLVTISGKSPVYGGSVKFQFDIKSKQIVW